MENRLKRGGIVGPLLLITLGVLFLLNNFGLVPWNIWYLLVDLWPLLLIAIGLDILIGRQSALGSLVVAVITLILFAGGIWYVSSQTLAPESQTAISYDLGGAQQGDVQIDTSVGTLQLGPSTDPGRLIEGEVALAAGERLREDSSHNGETAVYKLSSERPGGVVLPPFSRQRSIWDLRLNDSIPLQLRVSAGVGNSTLRLERLTLTALEMHTGVGTMTVTLPRQGHFSANIDGGIGRVVVRIPAEMAARIQADTGLGGLDIDDSFQRTGENVYVSAGYENAQSRVDLTVSGGIGQIVVTEVASE